MADTTHLPAGGSVLESAHALFKPTDFLIVSINVPLTLNYYYFLNLNLSITATNNKLLHILSLGYEQKTMILLPY